MATHATPTAAPHEAAERAHVLMITDGFGEGLPSGAETVVRECGRRLAARGYRVTVFAGRRCAQAPLFEREGDLEIVRYAAGGALTAMPSAVLRMRELLASKRVDVVISHFAYPAVPAALVMPRSVPWIRIFHGSWGQEGYLEDVAGKRPTPRALARRWIRERFDALDLRHSSRVVVLSAYAKALVMRTFRVPEARVVLCPGGVDTERFRPASDKPSLRAALGLRAEGRLVLFSGRLVRRKGVDVLLSALRVLRDRHPDVHLAVIGDGPERPHLERLTRDLHLSDAVRFIGFVGERLAAYYAAADLVVMPSQDGETFGLVTLEALASGVPVVGTRHGGTIEILEGLDHRLIASGTTTAALADAMAAFLERGASGEEDGERARAYAATYTWDRHVDVLEALVRDAHDPSLPASVPANGAPHLRLAIATPEVTRTDGMGSLTYAIVRAAAARGDRVTVICDRIAPDLRNDARLEWVRPPFGWVPTDLMRNVTCGVWTALWLARRRQRFDVVHVNGTAAFVRPDVDAVHYVYDAYLKTADGRSQPKTLRQVYHRVLALVERTLERLVVRHASRVVAVSNTVRDEVLALGVPRERTELIFNGIDLEQFRPGRADRTAYGLPADAPVLLFAGDIVSRRKNLDTVLDALANVPEVHLAVAGRTAGSIYPALVKERGLDARVHFLGFRSDLPDVMRACDFFVLLSHYEPFGLVITQAMATGMPVITSRNVGAAEFVRDGGFVLPAPRDAAGLERAIRALARDPDLRRHLGRRAHDIAQGFGLETMAERYLALYDAQGGSRALSRARLHNKHGDAVGQRHANGAAGEREPRGV